MSRTQEAIHIIQKYMIRNQLHSMQPAGIDLTDCRHDDGDNTHSML